jgi:twitching motility protein PilI
MAKRESKEDLQQRLEERLRNARSEGAGPSWLAVEAGGRKFLFPLTHAGEIFNAGAAHAVPYTQPWFRGVASLRGRVFGVVDFAAFVLGEQAPARDQAEAARNSARLVALNALFDVNCALLVDRLAGLRGADVFTASVAAPAATPPYFGHLYTDQNGEQWQEINLQLLAQQPAFLAVAA